ncbi:MAG: molybdopterin molybdenumtransferase MoeA [Cyanobacteria bacterium CYA]|nr:MAG: molybdopterin molybdenumtransferase MoeA [Cyanobacteria bacterium CYA]
MQRRQHGADRCPVRQGHPYPVGSGVHRSGTKDQHVEFHRRSVWFNVGGSPRSDMGFGGQDFVFDSPASAIAGMIARLGGATPARCPETADLDAEGPANPLGRVLAEDVRADRDSPAFDHAAMDGYAVRASSLAGAGGGPVVLTVTGEARIGCEPPVLPDGPVAVRIVTGAGIPSGADAVIRREDVVEELTGDGDAGRSDEVRSITAAAHLTGRLRPGAHIRRRGENASSGAVVLHAGDLVNASRLSTLAAVGITRPLVLPRVRVALVTTGDELVSPGEAPSTFQVRNSNAPAVRAILASPTWVEVAGVAHARDEGELDGVFRDACDAADAVILTGGVSMGHRDPVRGAIEAAGAQIVFHGLPQRPGKPMLGAVLKRTAGGASRTLPIFGLPGNPVSALVTCTRIVLPVLAAYAGARQTPPQCLPATVTLADPDGRTLDLWWHRLVRLRVDESGVSRAELVDTRGSGDVVAAGISDGFVEVPPSRSPSIVPFYPWPAS